MLKNSFLFVVLFLALAAPAAALSVECMDGANCAGWGLSVERDYYSDDGLFFEFRNNMGKPVFNPSVTVYYYDYFGELITARSVKFDGPCVELLSFEGRKPADASTIKAAIYYAETYQP